MDRPLVLSTFPGIDLLGMAFEMEGFCVVRGPDVIFGQDIRGWHVPVGKFEGVIGGPPCQFASRLRYVNPRCGQKHGNLIPEFERVILEVEPQWFVMECVPEAPTPEVAGYQTYHLLLNNRWFGAEQHRKRHFTFGTTAAGKSLEVDVVLFENSQWEPAVTASGGMRAVPVALVRDGKGGHRTKTALCNYGYATKRAFGDMCRLQGLAADFLSDAPFTVKGKSQVVGNGVPIPMGRAVAKAVKKAMGYEF